MASKPDPKTTKHCHRITITRTTPGHEKCLVDLSGWVELECLIADAESDLIEQGIISEDHLAFVEWSKDLGRG